MGEHFKDKEEKITWGMIVAGIAIIAILITSLIIYLLSANSNTKNIDDFSDLGSESTSIELGKTVNESANELESNLEISNNTIGNVVAENTLSTSKANTEKNETVKNETENDTTDNEVENEVKSEDTATDVKIKFTAPVKGEIIRDFAPDSLVYSNTLDEWVIHNGIDIKADKTSVITAVADGKVTGIKNDPRYGLTVIVTHEGGYKSVYANLLTAEFVTEGEEIEVGQTIGTVGNSAIFEVTDDNHLHFELLKDDEYVNPTNYMDF